MQPVDETVRLVQLAPQFGLLTAILASATRGRATTAALHPLKLVRNVGNPVMQLSQK